MFETLKHRWLRIPYNLHVHTYHRVKKPRQTILFLHGIGNSGEAWQKVIDKLPDDVQVISVDLLGFGISPRPDWAVYDAKRQAESVAATLAKLRISAPMMIVGHSLGALVAIEFARRHPRHTASLVLCSPPFMDTKASSDFMHEQRLKQLYRLIHTHPEQFMKISALAVKYKLASKGFSVTSADALPYMSALEASIINQTALYDAQLLTVPTTIIRGTLDPIVIPRHLRTLATSNHRVRLATVLATHEIKGRFVTKVIAEINNLIATPPDTHH